MKPRAGAFIFAALVASVVTAFVAMPAESAGPVPPPGPKPKITSFSPTTGAAGTSVKISGQFFNGATLIAFNGTPAQSFVVNSPSQVTAVVADGSTTGPISITTKTGTATSATVFTVAVSAEGADWVARYNGPGNGDDDPVATVSSPDGSTVYVAGEDWTGSDWEFGTIAYDASSGAVRWQAHYSGGLPEPGARAMALSPDGTRLFVAGEWQFGSAMVVYDAATGQQLWATSSSADAALPHRVGSVGVSPDGATVFLTGYKIAGDFNWDYDTVAFDAASDARLWTASYDGPAHGNDQPTALAVSTDGTKVFVTGRSPSETAEDYATVAYSTTTGAQLWVARYNGAIGGPDQARAIAASPDGTKVFVTGWSSDGTYANYATVAYVTATGAQLWASRYSSQTGDDIAEAIAVTPDSNEVVVTGHSQGSDSLHAVTIAYSTTTGAALWTDQAPHDVADQGSAIGVSPDGTKIYITGSGFSSSSDDFATVAYDALTGNTQWAHLFGGPNDTDQARALAVANDGTKVFVTGFSDTGSNTSNPSDWITIAYPS